MFLVLALLCYHCHLCVAPITACNLPSHTQDPACTSLFRLCVTDGALLQTFSVDTAVASLCQELIAIQHIHPAHTRDKWTVLISVHFKISALASGLSENVKTQLKHGRIMSHPTTLRPLLLSLQTCQSHQCWEVGQEYLAMIVVGR